MKHLILLGAGHAHAQVLQGFAREPLPAACVTLVSPFAQLVYSGMMPGVVAGHYTAADCTIAVAPLAARAGATFVQQAAVQIDAAARTLTLADASVLGFDTLSVDTGAVMDRDSIPGAREHALFVRPIEHFTQLLQPLLELAERRTLSLVLVGAGAGGVELALALQHRLGERARVSLVTGGPPPLPSHPASVQARGLRALKRLGVTVFEESCTSVEAGHGLLGSGARLLCDGRCSRSARAAPAVAAAALALDEQGFVATGADAAEHVTPATGSSPATSPAVSTAAAQNGVYARARRSAAGAEPAPLRRRRYTRAVPAAGHALNLLSCGDRRAIASWNDWSAEGRWVWWWKDRIDRGFVGRFGDGV